MMMICNSQNITILAVLLLANIICQCNGFNLVRGSCSSSSCRSLSMSTTVGDSNTYDQQNIMQVLGDEIIPTSNDKYESNKKSQFYLNVGKALEALRKELPVVFVVQQLDFSIFANQVTVSNGNLNKLVMSRSLYTAAVRSIQMASAFSSIYPSMNVKKIEFVEDCRTIQCLVDVVLPDSVRVDGSSVWEGMFYFGLNAEGLIDTHIFDRRITNLRPNPVMSVSQMPWLRKNTQWEKNLVPTLTIQDFSNIEIPDVDASFYKY